MILYVAVVYWVNEMSLIEYRYKMLLLKPSVMLAVSPSVIFHQ